MELEPEYTQAHAVSSCIFRPSPDPKLSWKEKTEESSDEEEDSSEEEDFDHSEHFFRLAKTQVLQLIQMLNLTRLEYEDMLKKEPNNETIRQRLENLLTSRNEELGIVDTVDGNQKKRARNSAPNPPSSFQ